MCLVVAGLLGVTRVASAQNDTVRVTCDALSADDAAQVEARTRATLLTTPDVTVLVRIECSGATVTVRAIAGERTESTVLTLPDDNPGEALLAAVEHTLQALERTDTTGGTTEPRLPPPPTVAAVPASPAVVGVSPPPADAPPPTSPSPPLERRPPAWELGAGVLGEAWQGAVGVGARVVVDQHAAPWTVGAALGWATPVGLDAAFGANELHAFAFAALEEARTTGVRGGAGIGLSALSVTPHPEVVATNSTSMSVVFFDAEVSRPVRFGQAWLLPALSLRLFPARREVTVDATRRLALPPLCPALFLGFGYEI